MIINFKNKIFKRQYVCTKFTNPNSYDPSIALRELLDSNQGLRIISETEKQKNSVHEQAIEILKTEKIALENKCTKLENEKTEKETLIQLMEEDLQSSKRVLQCVCALAGAILGGGLVLAFPPVGAAIALGGTGSAVAGGAALVGGATGGCLIAPVIHEKTHKAIIQQVQNFKTKEEVSKKAE